MLFRNGKIRTIVSVQMLNEGINVPDANVIVFLRNTTSPGVFYQQLGRGVRPAPGKKSVKVLDFVGNCERIQTILELKQETDDFRIQTPVEKPYAHGAGEADSREKFTLNIATPEFKSRAVDLLDLLERAQTEQWTKDKVIAGLQKMHDNGQKVTCMTVDRNPDLPCSTTIIHMFGGFSNALKEAGLQPNSNALFLSREEMLAVGKKMIARGIKITMYTVNDNPDLCSSQTICKEFGTIANFAALCGSDQKDFSRDGLLLSYWNESKKAGHWLIRKEIDTNNNLASAALYYKNFGKMKNIIKAAQDLCGPLLNKQESAQLQNEELQRRKEDIARQYYAASVKRGRWLKVHEIGTQNGMPGRRCCYKYFRNGIQEIRDLAYSLCGNLPDCVAQQNNLYVPGRDVIREYWEESQLVGRWIVCKEIDAIPRLISVKAYQRCIDGGIPGLRRLAIEKYGDFTKENATN